MKDSKEIPLEAELKMSDYSIDMLNGIQMALNTRVVALEMAINFMGSGHVLSDEDRTIEIAEKFHKFIIDDNEGL